MACCGAGAIIGRVRGRSRGPGRLSWIAHRPGVGWAETERALRPVCGPTGCEVPRGSKGPGAAPPGPCMGPGGCGGGGGCGGDTCCAVERSAGNPSDTIAGLDRADWDRMSAADRQAWLTRYAREQNLSNTARQQLYAQALSGSFDTLRGVINTVRDIELERIRQQGATDRTRITGRNEAEVALLARHQSNPNAFGHPGTTPTMGGGVASVALPMLLLALLK